MSESPKEINVFKGQEDAASCAPPAEVGENTPDFAQSAPLDSFASSTSNAVAPFGQNGANRGADGRFTKGNTAAVLTGARSRAFWSAADEARRELTNAVLTDCGHTVADAPRAILSNPSLIQLTVVAAKAKAPRSWIQIARTGSFKSNRYGAFAITKDDLQQMVHNFRNVTPKAPTELPVDYDHLSMDPRKPGDGVAAGWMKRVELREDGNELWAEVEWTPDGAERIANGEYRFVSPSFVKDHTYKDGTKIGTCLLAAAVTNHPFLEGMAALTLYSFSAIGDLALPDTPAAVINNRAVHLAEVGQRVGFSPDAEVTPELSDLERSQTFLVKSAIGAGDDQFLRLTTVDGVEFGWFRATQIAPAPNKHTKKGNPMPKNTKPDTDVQTALSQIAAARGIDLNTNLRAAVRLIDESTAAGYLEQFDSGATKPEPEAERPANIHNLTRNGEERFDQLVLRVAAERRIELHAAIKICREAFPALCQEYEAGASL